MSKNKLHILILYSVLVLALLVIGYPELVIPKAGKNIDKELKLRDQHDEDISKKYQSPVK